MSLRSLAVRLPSIVPILPCSVWAPPVQAAETARFAALEHQPERWEPTFGKKLMRHNNLNRRAEERRTARMPNPCPLRWPSIVVTSVA